MSHEIPESDWKLFRQFRTVALERFCGRSLTEIEQISSGSGRSFHERYLDVYRSLQKRDHELAEAFDDPRRSRAIMQLAAINSRGLLKPEELMRFTAATRHIVTALAEAG
jgi:inhibitor of KinA sporulation pathway (predicted exonuclease)